jgi:hypothetical protein
MEVGIDFLYPSNGPDGPERWSIMAPNKRERDWLAKGLGVTPPVDPTPPHVMTGVELEARRAAAIAQQKKPHELGPKELEARKQAAAELERILPPELQREQPTIIMGRFDEVTALAEQFNLQAKRLGLKYGIHGNPIFVQDPHMPEIDDEAGMFMKVMTVLAAGFSGMNAERETFQLTRIGDSGWGIYYRKAPSLMLAAAGQPKEEEIIQLITGCRIDIKRAFIRKAGKFFGDYLKQIKTTVADVDKDLSQGREVLDALNRVE